LQPKGWTKKHTDTEEHKVNTTIIIMPKHTNKLQVHSPSIMLNKSRIGLDLMCDINHSELQYNL